MRRFAALALVLGCVVPTACSAPGVRAHVGYGLYTLDGDLGISPTSAPAQSVDLEDDLGLDEFSSSFQVRVEADAGPVRVSGSGFRYNASGNGMLTADFGDIIVGGPTLSTPVQSSIDVLNTKIAVTADVLDIGPVRVSPGLALDILDVDGRVTEVTTGISESYGETLPIPMPFVQAEVSLFDFDLVAELGGIGANLSEFDGTLLDFEAYVTYSPMEPVELYLGYRLLQLDGDGVIDGQGYDADVRLQGIFIGAGIDL